MTPGQKLTVLLAAVGAIVGGAGFVVGMEAGRGACERVAPGPSVRISGERLNVADNTFSCAGAEP